jgi:WD40 repeat protein
LMTLKGHADEVTSVTFSIDGKGLTTGGNDGTLRLWRAAP